MKWKPKNLAKDLNSNLFKGTTQILGPKNLPERLKQFIEFGEISSQKLPNSSSLPRVTI